MKNSLFLALFIMLLSSIVFGQTKKVESLYSGLSDKDCKAIETPDDGDDGYRGLCKGVGGFKLELLEGDLRQTINVVAPNGTKSELNLWGAVSGGFSSVGNKAEWRVSQNGKTVTPKALILRFNASENPEDSTKITSYLVVVKIAGNTACITEIIKPSANQNEKARESADASVNKPCKAVE